MRTRSTNKKTVYKIGSMVFKLAGQQSFTRHDITEVSKHNMMAVILELSLANKISHGVYKWSAPPTLDLISDLEDAYYHLCSWYNVKTKYNGK
jgi:hypothetical protein